MLLLWTLGACSLLTSLALTPFFRDFFAFLEMVDHPGNPRKLHLRPIPRVGGISIRHQLLSRPGGRLADAVHMAAAIRRKRSWSGLTVEAAAGAGDRLSNRAARRFSWVDSLAKAGRTVGGGSLGLQRGYPVLGAGQQSPNRLLGFSAEHLVVGLLRQRFQPDRWSRRVGVGRRTARGRSFDDGRDDSSSGGAGFGESRHF
jgi:hypothetical protein